MGYQVNPVGTYWLLEDMVELGSSRCMAHMHSPTCVPTGTSGVTLDKR